MSTKEKLLFTYQQMEACWQESRLSFAKECGNDMSEEEEEFPVAKNFNDFIDILLGSLSKEEGKDEVLQQEFENAVAECADNHIKIEALEQEIERLKGLIKKAHTRGWIDFPQEFEINKHESIESSWAQFAKENGLKGEGE